MKFFTAILATCVLLATACVPQQQYTELEETLAYYKGEALATDSIRGANQRIAEDNNQTQAEYQQLTRELERLTATNISLNKNYQDIVNRYNNLVGDNQQILQTTSYETQQLEQELSLRQSELDNKERSLTQAEQQLRSRDRELQRLEARGAYGNPTDYSYAPDARYEQLNNQKINIDQQRDALVTYFQRVLVGFPEEEVNIGVTDNSVTLTLNQNLLFPNGDVNAVHWKGRQALQQIAVVLRDNPSLPVHVVGHVNPSSNPDLDWELSLDRSLTVAQDLATFGVNTSRLTPQGKGSNVPIVAATSARAQLVNGRTVIELPLDYLQLIEGLGN